MTEQDRISAYIAQENAAAYAKRAMFPNQERNPSPNLERMARKYDQMCAAIYYARARRVMGIETGEHDHGDDC